MEARFNFFKSFSHSPITGITFDDILLVPEYSEINSRADCDVSTRLSRNVPMKIPIVSSPMDSVTEFRMALEMARNGGVGVVHRFQSLDEQARTIRRVKKAENIFISDPYIVDIDESVEALISVSELLDKQSFLVADLKKSKHTLPPELNGVTTSVVRLTPEDHIELQGIVTGRDLKARTSKQKVRDLMTPREKLTVFARPENQKIEKGNIKELWRLMLDHRVEKLPVVDAKNNIVGLVTERDINRSLNANHSNLNSRGSLIVGAAIGSKDDFIERAEVLVGAGCDVLIVDIANGHNLVNLQALDQIKGKFKVDVIGGNVATGDGARRSIEHGSDAIRCGLGNGSICSTRLVSGCGVPQVAALMDVLGAADEHGVPVISDGGIRTSGAMAKALALGASSVMLGNMLAGTDESPGLPFLKDGTFVKIHRGMAGFGANLSRAERTKGAEPNSVRFTPEGVEGFVPYKGPLADNLHQMVMGIKSGMSYVGAKDLKEFSKMAHFVVSSISGIVESGISVNKI